MAALRSLPGAREMHPTFLTRTRGQGPWAELLKTRFEIACRKYGLKQAKFPLRTDLFRPPEGDQMRLI
jgi:hypothetical protein